MRHITEEEEILDPWVEEYNKNNPRGSVSDRPEMTPEELRAFTRGPTPPAPSDKEISRITDDAIEGIPIRFYEHKSPTGVIVYYHGGGFSIGSIGFMDNMARE